MATFDEAARDRFVADPVAFIDNAALMIAGSVSRPELRGQPDRLTLEYQPTATAYRQIDIGDDVGMQWVPFYILRKARPDDAATFRAYIIEYVDGETPMTTLGREARLAFTANMNGCTLGIGSQPTRHDALVVTHSNSRGFGSQDANTADQRARAGAVVGAGGRLFEPSAYRTHGKQSITFGVRPRGRKWAFHFLSYRRAQGRVTTYGVRPVITSRVEG